MNDKINWLITVLYRDQLMRCALQVQRGSLPGDCEDSPMEPENREAIHALLPLHVQSCGPIVAIEEVFEIHVVTEEEILRKLRQRMVLQQLKKEHDQ